MMRSACPLAGTDAAEHLMEEDQLQVDAWVDRKGSVLQPLVKMCFSNMRSKILL